MSENKSAIILSGLSVRNLYNQAEELVDYVYIVENVRHPELPECEWCVGVNIEFVNILFAGEPHPHQKLFDFFISIINTGFVPIEFPKAENASLTFELINRSENLCYTLIINCVKCQDVPNVSSVYGLTWHISEYFGELDLLPETLFLDSTIDDAVLMGKEVLQWNRAAIHLTEVKHPFVQKIIAAFKQNERIDVCL